MTTNGAPAHKHKVADIVSLLRRFLYFGKLTVALQVARCLWPPRDRARRKWDAWVDGDEDKVCSRSAIGGRPYCGMSTHEYVWILLIGGEVDWQSSQPFKPLSWLRPLHPWGPRLLGQVATSSQHKTTLLPPSPPRGPLCKSISRQGPTLLD